MSKEAVKAISTLLGVDPMDIELKIRSDEGYSQLMNKCHFALIDIFTGCDIEHHRVIGSWWVIYDQTLEVGGYGSTFDDAVLYAVKKYIL
jgi:hypothetical protein